MNTCRICFEEGSGLCSPCACAGSSKFVHAECVLRWINTSHRSRCEICHKDYAFAHDAIRRQEVPLSVCCIRFITSPLFHIGVQCIMLIDAVLDNTLDISVVIRLFLVQHFWTIAAYLIYAMVRVHTWRRYVDHFQHSSPVPLIPIMTAHVTLLLFVILSRAIQTSAGSTTVFLVTMTFCQCILCIYPHCHNHTIMTMNRYR